MNQTGLNCIGNDSGGSGRIALELVEKYLVVSPGYGEDCFLQFGPNLGTNCNKLAISRIEVFDILQISFGKTIGIGTNLFCGTGGLGKADEGAVAGAGPAFLLRHGDGGAGAFSAFFSLTPPELRRSKRAQPAYSQLRHY